MRTRLIILAVFIALMLGTTTISFEPEKREFVESVSTFVCPAKKENIIGSIQLGQSGVKSALVDKKNRSLKKSKERSLPILKGFDYQFSKGERIGIVGKNGVGKSTFLNILQGIEPADSGKINIGDTVVFGNFSQQGLVFKENVRVIEYVKSFAENFPLADGTTLSAAQFLELFLFTPDRKSVV